MTPAGFESRRTDAIEVVVRAELASQPIESWWQDGEPLPGAAGRRAVRRARIGDVEAVLRDYRRGGALRGVLPELFWSPRRAFDELAITATLHAAGVPIVEPLAAIARRRGVGFELRLATRFLPDALPLPRFVATYPARRRAAVRRAGEVVGAAFRAGLHHRDLHPDNLIARVDANQGGIEVLLLDFDRARLVPQVPPALRDRMLVRMARYLRRHATKLDVIPSRTDHLRFLAGLGLDRAERKNAWQSLAAALRRALRLRGLDVTA